MASAIVSTRQTLTDVPAAADNRFVGWLMAAAALVTVLALAIGVHLVWMGATPRISWHRVSFAGVLFWSWYLADAIPLASALSFFLP